MIIYREKAIEKRSNIRIMNGTLGLYRIHVCITLYGKYNNLNVRRKQTIKPTFMKIILYRCLGNKRNQPHTLV